MADEGEEEGEGVEDDVGFAVCWVREKGGVVSRFNFWLEVGERMG